MKAPVYNLKGETKEEIELSSKVFNEQLNKPLVLQVYKDLVSNQREPLAFAKNRSEIRGGGRKPWAQKGTGRARHGSIRSPLWKGGGVTFWPRTKEERGKKKINKKVKEKAFKMVLSQKLRDKEIKVIESVEMEKPQTNMIDSLCKNIIGEKKKIPSILFVIHSQEKDLFRSAQNLPYLKVINTENMNLIDLLNYKYLLFSTKGLMELEKKY